MSVRSTSKFLNRVGGFAAGVLGSKTAAYSMIKNMPKEVGAGKAFMNGLKYNAASTAGPLGVIAMAPKLVKEAGEGHGWMGYKLSGLGQTALMGAGLTTGGALLANIVQ